MKSLGKSWAGASLEKSPQSSSSVLGDEGFIHLPSVGWEQVQGSGCQGNPSPHIPGGRRSSKAAGFWWFESKQVQPADRWLKTLARTALDHGTGVQGSPVARLYPLIPGMTAGGNSSEISDNGSDLQPSAGMFFTLIGFCWESW